VNISRAHAPSGRFAFALAFLVASSVSAARGADAVAPVRPPATPITSTLAGSGLRGVVDGAASVARFMVPAAVAVAPDGSIVVADEAAQNVRRITGGVVTTLAGDAPPGMTPEERRGGYLDGPAGSARFDRPVGVAVARNGDVYVADAGNRCIRKISNGVVSTFSGSRAPGHADGDARIAQFDDLKGIAIDDDGLVYVADYGVGIRRVDAAGTVTTITRPEDEKTVLDVAVRGGGAHTVIAYGDALRLHVLAGAKSQDVAYADPREPAASDLGLGRADAIALVNANTLVVADASTNAVRLLRLPAPPFLTDRMSRTLSGGVREADDLSGGYAEGPPDVALLRAPRGVAIARDGTLVVADCGNRRIRAIAHVDPRESVLPGAAAFTMTRKAYRIAVVGNSYAFYNVLWPESIPGRIEALLAQDGPALGLHTRPAVAVFRVDDLSAASGASLIHEELGDGEADLVILMLNAYDPWDPSALDDLQSALQATGTRLMLVYTPQGFEVSPLDFPDGVRERNVDFNALHAEASKGESFYNRTTIESLFLLDAMSAWDDVPDHPPLFYVADHHFTVYGSQWVGERIAAELERWRPWQPPAS
jgi:hypothetical protein